MSSSDSGSSRTPSPSGSPSTSPNLSSFDPFAVHPFTRYAGSSQPQSAHSRSAGTHVLPHPSMLNIDGHVPSQLQHPASQYPSSNYSHQAVGSGYNQYGQPSYPQSSMNPSQNFKPIHVPFRQDTSSPDLGDVLRRKQMGQ
ncbi:hypothetical protein FA15DRAFT_340223 [Coprinopsis marcescibilis]|uniref:Uncharacterized protein n=1 Tax=Coprinopsis marcescibilis TaxID=230819 RepID=A0A5C3KYG5_COPMA|nr:hypothetical protein FA15DRAFT_340223 [Coprinopsis marcescibilis]